MTVALKMAQVKRMPQILSPKPSFQAAAERAAQAEEREEERAQVNPGPNISYGNEIYHTGDVQFTTHNEIYYTPEAVV